MSFSDSSSSSQVVTPGATAFSSSSRISLTMRPASRMRAISSLFMISTRLMAASGRRRKGTRAPAVKPARNASCGGSGLAQGLLEFLVDTLWRTHAIDALEEPPLRVELLQGRGLRVVLLQPPLDDLGRVVLSLDDGRIVLVTKASLLRRVLGDMVDGATGRTRSPPRTSLDERLVRHLERHHGAEPLTHLGEHSLEGFGLRRGGGWGESGPG